MKKRKEKVKGEVHCLTGGSKCPYCHRRKI